MEISKIKYDVPRIVNGIVDPWTYGSSWFLKDLETKRIIKKKCRIDVRSLEEVGIVGDMVLTAEFVQKA